ncbi:hypothetical protein [Ammoniphilus sp. CFH 90114]|uniref:hypothetical protein n=1 Tax=Ammoniphilus sp. CFH 90114 TaxID=2493665 RepID=UPI00100FAA67|nr:hypothetical protein [Ammoniphilus sp. CFH 90114]RXT13923.1 hypothetical protein EIZ39_07250 [Ammoniphilus sp. CFH 90114]
MNRYLGYLFFSTGLLSTMVLVKLWVIPFTLWHLFPQNDLVSRLYEVLIMGFGGVTFLLFIVLGYLGKHAFHINLSKHLFLHFVIQFPFAMHAILQEVTDARPLIGVARVFAEGWCGLIAEPTRLLFMVYPWTDIFAIFASFVFLSIGRTIDIVDEDKDWIGQRKRIKVGRV